MNGARCSVCDDPGRIKIDGKWYCWPCLDVASSGPDASPAAEAEEPSPESAAQEALGWRRTAGSITPMLIQSTTLAAPKADGAQAEATIKVGVLQARSKVYAAIIAGAAAVLVAVITVLYAFRTSTPPQTITQFFGAPSASATAATCTPIVLRGARQTKPDERGAFRYEGPAITGCVQRGKTADDISVSVDGDSSGLSDRVALQVPPELGAGDALFLLVPVTEASGLTEELGPPSAYRLSRDDSAPGLWLGTAWQPRTPGRAADAHAPTGGAMPWGGGISRSVPGPNGGPGAGAKPRSPAALDDPELARAIARVKRALAACLEESGRATAKAEVHVEMRRGALPLVTTSGAPEAAACLRLRVSGVPLLSQRDGRFDIPVHRLDPNK
ncbi:MAG: hypothetical protein IT373_37155 [Polyangiaceae bacterium]|nr:hypothetical protein [Polyangiaceae bacterium]